MMRELEWRCASDSCFFNETFSTNTLVEAEVDDAMVNHLNPGEPRHDTTTGVSWKSGVGSFLFFFFSFPFCCCPVPITMSAISISFWFITFLSLHEDVRGWRLFFFFFFFLSKNQGISLWSWSGVFLGARPRTSYGRFSSASTSLSRTVDNSLLESGRGRQKVRRCGECHREREPRGAGFLRGRIQ
ncbi:hypothetical protein V8C35DRAFT_251603 [Trichoderma chlorosporum]